MSGGKGGSQTTQVEIPAWLEDAAKRNIAKAEDISQTGFVPYYGPEVAAMTPMQEAAMQNTSQAAQAYGLSAAPGQEIMPEPQTFAGGVRAYSSGSLFDQALAELEARRPGQFEALNAPFINPVRGQSPGAPYLTGVRQPVVNTVQNAAPQSSNNFGGGGGPNVGVNASGGVGYTGLGDMFDGGGPGASGDTFQGGGMVSTIGNAVTSPTGSRGFQGPAGNDGPNGGMGGGK